MLVAFLSLTIFFLIAAIISFKKRNKGRSLVFSALTACNLLFMVYMNYLMKL